jgi:predicted RNA-binding Zn-ribbon protein involved in translation (DUF1610 family)
MWWNPLHRRRYSIAERSDIFLMETFCDVCRERVFPISFDGIFLCPKCGVVMRPKEGSIKELAIAQERWREKNVQKMDGE